jgi:hypothetical protein
MRFCNILRCLLATSAVALPPLPCVAAAAQHTASPPAATAPGVTSPGDTPAAEPENRRSPPPLDTPREPDVASCVNGFLVAREWISLLEAPPVDAPDSAVALPGVRGICVLLRLDGRIIGVGEEWPGSVGDDRMLRRAVARAIAAAMGDELLRGLSEEVRATAGSRLMLEIEFAGRPEPLLGRTLDECAARIDRGLDGIAFRRGFPGSIEWFVAFPSRMLASNTARDPRGTLARLIRESGLPDRDLPDLARIEPIGTFRFASLRLAQSTPEAPPAPRGRGVTRVIDDEVTRDSVRAHTMGILRRVARALPPAEGLDGMPRGIGSFGNYIPVRDSYEPLIAPPQDQALLAWAAAAVASSTAFTAEERHEALEIARRLLDDFIETAPTESQPLALVPAMVGFACAMELVTQEAIAHRDDAGDGGDGGDGGGAEPINPDLFDAARIAREKLADRLARGNSPSERALAAVAAAMTVGTERRFIPAQELRTIIDSLWETADPKQLVSILPWLVLADAAYARATGEPEVHAEKAQAIMKSLFLVQAGFAELAADADLRGGFRLSGERRAGVTSQSLRPGLALAGMLSFAGFVPSGTDEGRATTELFRKRLIALLRFSQELTVSGDLARLFRNPGRVEGGVREALWDSEQHVAANAMALLVNVEALRADPWGPLPEATPIEP